MRIRNLEPLNLHKMQERQRNPEHEEREGANARAEGIRKHHPPPGTGPIRRTRHLLIQHLIEAIQHAANPDHHVPQRATPGLGIRRVIRPARAPARLGAVFGGGGDGLLGAAVAVRDHEHARDGDGDGDDFGPAQALVQQRHGEGVGEEGAAVVDGREVARGREVDGDVPAPAGDGEGAGDERRPFDDVGHRRLFRLGRGEVEGLVLHHLRGLSQEGEVSAPEGGPGGGEGLEAEDEELGWPEEGP